MSINEAKHAAKIPLFMTKEVIEQNIVGRNTIEEGAIRRVGMKEEQANQRNFITVKATHLNKSNITKDNTLNIHKLKKSNHHTTTIKASNQITNQFRNLLEEKAFNQKDSMIHKASSKRTVFNNLS